MFVPAPPLSLAMPRANVRLGKILKDDATVGGLNIKEKDFLVVMVSKPKAAPAAAAAPAPAASPAPAAAAAPAASESSSAAPAAAASTSAPATEAPAAAAAPAAETTTSAPAATETPAAVDTGIPLGSSFRASYMSALR